jgi:uncharacterized protein (DUF1778 family)
MGENLTDRVHAASLPRQGAAACEQSVNDFLLIAAMQARATCLLDAPMLPYKIKV